MPNAPHLLSWKLTWLSDLFFTTSSRDRKFVCARWPSSLSSSCFFFKFKIPLDRLSQLVYRHLVSFTRNVCLH